MKINPTEIRRILIIKLGGLGDAFLSTVVLDSLREYYSLATIDFFVDKSGCGSVENDPRIHSIFALDKQHMNPLSVIAHVRRERYDMVIDLFGNPRSAVITFLSGARYRAGLDYGWRRHLYSIVGKAHRERLHGAEVNLQILPALGVPRHSARLRYYLSQDDEEFGRQYWENNSLSGKFVIGVLPTGSWSSKRCEPAKFGEIVRAFVQQLGVVCLLVWGPSDEQDAREISRIAGDGVTVGPRASLRQNMSLLSRCGAIIANDSGPMHIASSFGVPILCLYGPTYPEGPYGEVHAWVRNEGLSCLVCNLLECPIQHQCMRDLRVEQVVEAFDRMLQKNGLRPLPPVGH